MADQVEIVELSHVNDPHCYWCNAQFSGNGHQCQSFHIVCCSTECSSKIDKCTSIMGVLLDEFIYVCASCTKPQVHKPPIKQVEDNKFCCTVKCREEFNKV